MKWGSSPIPRHVRHRTLTHGDVPRWSRGVTVNGLYALKPAFVAGLRGIEDTAVRRGITADAVTIAALAVAGVTAAVLVVGTWHPLVWLAVAPLSLLRMACNAVDGSLARRTGAATRRGWVLNEFGDRVADTVTFAALAPAVGVLLAMAVVLTALATSFVAVLAHAVLGERLATGPLGKPDRVAVLSAAAGLAAFAGPSALAAGAWTLVALGVVTLVGRTVVLWRRAGGAA